jgi:hypothetical protein
MDKGRYTLFLLEQVIPASMEWWPRANRTIRLQQDNAKPHLSLDELAEVYEKNREHLQRVFGGDLIWEISLFNQPANSPDLNLNDLAFSLFFKGSILEGSCSNSRWGMLVKMAEIYLNYPGQKLLSIGFMTLQVSIMSQIIEYNGGNDF